MRLFLAALLLLQYVPFGHPPAPATGGGALPAIVGTPGLSFANGSLTAAQTNHTAGGRTCVVAFIGFFTASGVPTNTAGYTFVLSASNLTQDVGYSIYEWCAPTTNFSGTDTVTVPATGSVIHGGVVFFDISNVTAVDNSASVSNNSGFNSVTSGNYTVAGPNDMVISEAASAGGTSVQAGATSLTAVCAGCGFWGADAFQLVQYQQITGTPANATMGASTGFDLLTVGHK